jgi:hypothetical protein
MTFLINKNEVCNISLGKISKIVSIKGVMESGHYIVIIFNEYELVLPFKVNPNIDLTKVVKIIQKINNEYNFIEYDEFIEIVEIELKGEQKCN